MYRHVYEILNETEMEAKIVRDMNIGKRESKQNEKHKKFKSGWGGD